MSKSNVGGVRVSARVWLGTGNFAYTGYVCASLEESLQKLFEKISRVNAGLQVTRVHVTAGLKENGEYGLNQHLHQHLKSMVSEMTYSFPVEAVYGLP